MSNSVDGQGTSPSLQLVKEVDEIRQNIRRFCSGIEQNMSRAESLAKQTTFWTYDAERDLFGPAKFVGYRGMDFARYESATNGGSTGVAFDGHVTKKGIEQAVGPFIASSELMDRLEDWISVQIGEDVVAGINKDKWRFIELDSNRNYWAVVCNPDTYDGLSAVAVLEEIHWRLDRGNPQPGDRIIVWQAKGRHGRRGVIAMGEVTAPPDFYDETELENKYWVTDPSNEPIQRTRFRVLQLPNLPIWESDHPEILSGLAAARARGGTVFSLEPEQWKAILSISGSEERTLFSRRKQRATGQGFGLTGDERIAVEMHAQAMAEHHFLEQDYEVSDVSKTHSYDLHCRRGDDVLRVEVKGTTGSGGSVFLTRNEVEHAREHADHVALFVVRNISLDRSGLKPVASGGDAEVFQPWNIDQGTLEALQFEYRLPEGHEDA